MKRRDLLWHYVYIVLFAGLGAACLCLDRVYDYTIPMTVVGFCWLALAAGAATAARAARRSGRDFQSLLQGCGCVVVGATGLCWGLANKDAFQQFIGVLWLGLAAQWLIRGIRRLREGGDAG